MPPRRECRPVERRPMTSDEERMAVQLGVCRFVPGVADKRLAHALRDRVYASLHTAPGKPGPDAEISDGEARMLRVLVHRYRRQLDAATVALAGPPPRRAERA